MCKCRPEVRTPCCGSKECGHPDNCFHLSQKQNQEAQSLNLIKAMEDILLLHDLRMIQCKTRMGSLITVKPEHPSLRPAKND